MSSERDRGRRRSSQTPKKGTPAIPAVKGKIKSSAVAVLKKPPSAGAKPAYGKFQFLFRYRNLVAETIASHRDIIDHAGACWWGWWRRPTEDARVDVWRALAEATANGPVTVGLFDSGETNQHLSVRRAIVTAVIQPIAVAADQVDVPEVPATEVDLIPEYYRRSPFSRAWMKLHAIEDSPFEFFGAHSYASAPPLHGVAPQDLAFLANKVVEDHAELRSMDTTIWHVRPTAPEDTRGRFRSGSLKLLEPLTSEVVPLASSAILHLTDIHFDSHPHNGHAWHPAPGNSTTLSDAITLSIGTARIGLIVVSGDLTQIASPTEFEAAYRFLYSLLGKYNLRSDHLVVVPGNHDIAWVKGEKYVSDAPVKEAPDAAQAAYRNFYRKFFLHEPNADLSMGRRYVTPEGVVLEVCALNSSSLAQNAGYFAGMGRVGPSAFDRVREALSWKNRQSAALRMVVVHHHLTATEDVESPDEYYKGFGMAIDAKYILRSAAKNGVHLVVHGHRHRPFVWRENVYNLPDKPANEYQLGAVNILGGGSAGSAAVEAKRNAFNVVRVTPSRVEVDMHMTSEGRSFDVTAKWHAKLSLESGELKLAEWTKDPVQK